MMRKVTVLFFLVTVLVSDGFGQVMDTVHRFASGDRGWELDDLGNLYVYDSYEIRRYDRDMQLTASFSSREYGSISAIDVSDPLKPLVFYSMFSKVVELDNAFALSLTWSPQLDGIGQPLIGCRSTGPGYWFFNQIGLQPVMVDQTGKVVSAGTSLKSVSNGDITISDMVCKGPWMVLIDKSFGFYVFDQYGTFANKIPIQGGVFSGLTNTDLYYLQGDKLFKRNIRTGMETEFKLDHLSGVTSIKVQMGICFLQVGAALIKIDL